MARDRIQIIEFLSKLPTRSTKIERNTAPALSYRRRQPARVSRLDYPITAKSIRNRHRKMFGYGHNYHTRATNIPLLNRTLLFKSATNRKFEYCCYIDINLYLRCSLGTNMRREYGMCLLIHATSSNFYKFHTYHFEFKWRLFYY